VTSDHIRSGDQIPLPSLPPAQIIKFYTWELPFAKKIDEHRRGEILKLREKAKVQVMLYSVMTGAPIVVIIVSVAVFVATHSAAELDPVRLFTVLVR
jgi:hypothetical protein